VSFKDATRRRTPVKEFQEKKYPLLDSDLSGMLDDLLEKGVIQLLEPKRLGEVRRTTDPEYYRYHRMVSHPLKNASHLKRVSHGLPKMGE